MNKVIVLLISLLIVGVIALLVTNNIPAENKYNKYSLIAIDINKNSVIDKIAHKNTKASFDFNGNDFANDTEWIDEDYILAYDFDKNGKINYGKDFFYDEKVSKINMLVLLDSNRDGKINDKDPEHKYIRFFSDKDKDGVIDKGEILFFNSFDIDLKKRKIRIHEDSYDFKETKLVPSLRFTRYSKAPTITAEIMVLPLLRGYGEIYDSYIKYSLDDKFLKLAKKLSNSNPTQIEKDFPRFFKSWTGLNKINISSIKRNDFTLDERTWIQETFYGNNVLKDKIEEAFKKNIQTDIRYNVEYVIKHFNSLYNSYLSKFLVQSSYKKILIGAYYHIGKDKMVNTSQKLIYKSIKNYLDKETETDEIKRFARTLAYLNIEDVLFTLDILEMIEFKKKKIFLTEYRKHLKMR